MEGLKNIYDLVPPHDVSWYFRLLFSTQKRKEWKNRRVIRIFMIWFLHTIRLGISDCFSQRKDAKNERIEDFKNFNKPDIPNDAAVYERLLLT